ncbi:hypothetical protein D3C80_2057520 [compost metagenome]
MEDREVEGALRLSVRVLQDGGHRAFLDSTQCIGNAIDTGNGKIAHFEIGGFDRFDCTQCHFIVLTDHAVDLAGMSRQPVLH